MRSFKGMNEEVLLLEIGRSAEMSILLELSVLKPPQLSHGKALTGIVPCIIHAYDRSAEMSKTSP